MERRKVENYRAIAISTVLFLSFTFPSSFSSSPLNTKIWWAPIHLISEGDNLTSNRPFGMIPGVLVQYYYRFCLFG